MRDFETWLKETIKKINELDMDDSKKLRLLISLKSLKENKTLHNLVELMKLLHHYGLHDLCPKSSEIDYWNNQKMLRP